MRSSRFSPLCILHVLAVAIMLLFDAQGVTAADPKTYTFDLRGAIAPGEGAHYLVIGARYPEFTKDELAKLPSGFSPGHAWVVFGKEDDQKKQSVVEASFGFWPKDNGRAKLLNAVDGKVVNELLDDEKLRAQFKISHRIILRVSKSQYDKALEEAKRWTNAEPKYQTLIQNCTHFTLAVVNATGLDIPVDMTQFPPEYAATLAERIGKLNGPAR